MLSESYHSICQSRKLFMNMLPEFTKVKDHNWLDFILRMRVNTMHCESEKEEGKKSTQLFKYWAQLFNYGESDFLGIKIQV